MQAGQEIGRGGCLNHASELSTIFGRKACGHDSHSLNIFRWEGWRKRRRSVLSERKTIDHKRNVVLRAAGVENAVGLINPARLGVNNISKAPPQLRRDFLSNSL